MHSLQQMIKISAGGVGGGSVGNIANNDLVKILKFLTNVAMPRSVTSSAKQSEPQQNDEHETSGMTRTTATSPKVIATSTATATTSRVNFNIATAVSLTSQLDVNGCCSSSLSNSLLFIGGSNQNNVNAANSLFKQERTISKLQNFYQQQQFIHTHHNQSETPYPKPVNQQQQQHQHHQSAAAATSPPGTPSPSQQQQQTPSHAMSSLAAEPLQAHNDELLAAGIGSVGVDDATSSVAGAAVATATINGSSCHDIPAAAASALASSATLAADKKPCFNTGLAEILQFMELIGNLKHTKRTGWVLRDVNDCESISGHMYRMSMLTFLLDGSEGLNQIRCMQLALVHDLAESLVGDITPFCGVSKDEKRAMEFKAMEDICKLIEPRGKRIMELFEEYEHGESAESKFVKDLDRLDMVMQAFEYEKRDNCLLKHQEFFDSTEGKFNHPFVKKLVNEIYEQRQVLANAKGATPPPPVHVPSMESSSSPSSSSSSTSTQQQPQQQQSNGQQQQTS